MALSEYNSNIIIFVFVGLLVTAIAFVPSILVVIKDFNKPVSVQWL